MTGLFGGAFDPPHKGHLALAETALHHFRLDRLVVLVVVDPGHRRVELDFEARLRLARLAFGALPGAEIVPEEHRYTIDAVQGGRYGDAIFLIGADEFAGFPAWKEPNRVLEEVRLGVATRPGYPREVLEDALAELEEPDRVEFFDIPALPISATDIRERVARGEPVDDLVPEAVAAEILKGGLYR